MSKNNHEQEQCNILSLVLPSGDTLILEFSDDGEKPGVIEHLIDLLSKLCIRQLTDPDDKKDEEA